MLAKAPIVTLRAKHGRSRAMPTLFLRSMPTLLTVLLVILATGCDDDVDDFNVSNDGPIVGGPCLDIVDCRSRSFCATGADFPAGTCTLRCDDHDECPGPSLCMDKEGGACLLACSRDADCRGGYKCKDVNDRRGGGKSLVCIK
jgi:hypothetical protein